MNLRKDHCHAPAARRRPFGGPPPRCGSYSKRAARLARESRGASPKPKHTVNPQSSVGRVARAAHVDARFRPGDSRFPCSAPHRASREHNTKKTQTTHFRTELKGRRDATLPNPAITSNEMTTFSNGYLGSCNDEERSEMRYVMRIAEL